MSRLAVFRAVTLVTCISLLTAHLSLAATPVRQLTNTTASNLRPAWSQDGRSIAFQSHRDGTYHVYLIDADGGNERQLTSGAFDDRHPAWSPDGKLIAVDSGDDARREIWVVDVATASRWPVTNLGAITSFPSFSPDGRWISFYVYQAGAMDLWLVGADGSGEAPLTRNLASEANKQCTFACHAAAWSPDSSRIAISDGDQARILLMSALGGSPPVSISPDGERSHFPIYLPDGRVVYVTEHVSQEQSWTDLWAVNPDTGESRTALARGVQHQGPFELSPDGRQLLFASPRSGNFEIYAVTLDEEGKAALATKPERLRPPPESAVKELPAPRVAAPLSAPQRAATAPQSTTWTPYLAALGALAIAAAAVEAALWMRRRRRASR